MDQCFLLSWELLLQSMHQTTNLPTHSSNHQPSPPIHQTTNPPTHLSNHQPTHPCIKPPTYSPKHQTTNLTTQASNHQPNHPSIKPKQTHQPLHQTPNLPTHPSNKPTHQLIYFIHSFNYFFINSMIFRFIHCSQDLIYSIHMTAVLLFSFEQVEKLISGPVLQGLDTVLSECIQVCY